MKKRFWIGFLWAAAAGLTTASPALSADITAPAANSVFNGTIGQSLLVPVSATGWPVTFKAIGLPPGLSFNNFLGPHLQGTPTASGSYTATLSATDESGTTSEILFFTIVSPPKPVLTSGAFPTAMLDSDFNYRITASNNPTNYGAVDLPDGLSLDGTSGFISGVPTVMGQFPVKLSASNAGGMAESVFSLTVQNAPPVITSPGMASGTAGQFFFYQITATHQPTSFSAFNVPAGLTFDAEHGLIYGTVQSAFIGHAIPISATNSTATVWGALVLAMAPALSTAPVITGPTITLTASPMSITPGQSTQLSWTATAATSVSLNQGIGSIAASGSQRIAPSVTTTYTLTATGPGGTATQQITIIVDPAPSRPGLTITSITADPTPVTGTQTTLLVAVQDSSGTDHLTYTWASTPTDPARFRGSTNTPTPMAYFTQPGSYVFNVTVQDAQGRFSSGSVTVNVNQTLSGLLVHPPSVPLQSGTPYTFTVTPTDQWNQVITPAPAVTWSAPGASFLNGVFTAGTAGTYKVSVSAPGITGQTTVTVLQASTRPAVLTVGSATGTAGTFVWLPVSLAPSSDAPLSALEFNVALPAGLSLANVSLGSAASSAGKLLSVGPHNKPVLILGGIGVMSAGPIANLQVQIASGASAGPLPVALTNIEGSSPAADQVSVNAVSGSVLVSADSADSAGQSFPAQAPLSPVDFSAIKIYPNPWRADRPMDGIHFENVPDGSTIKIFTLSGRWVQTLSTTHGQAIWTLRNASGDAVASGLYFYLMTHERQPDLRGKLAIIR